MPDHKRNLLPHIEGDRLVLGDGEVLIGSPGWYAWLADQHTRSFTMETALGSLTVRRELQRSRPYFYAYHKRQGRLRKGYLGKAEDLTLDHLHAMARRLTSRDQPRRPEGTRLLELRFLGAPQILRDQQPIDGLPTKALALLAYLAARGTPQPREQLLALLWPESSTSAAHKNLRNTLWAIRTLLDDVLLVLPDGRLTLADLHQTDIGRFAQLAPPPVDPATSQQLAHAEATTSEQLAARLALYRGPLLDGIALHDAAEFELWLTAEREHMQQLYVRGATALIERYWSEAAWRQMAATAEHALIHEPLDEALYRARMEALARAGDRAGALRSYDILRATLERELGLAPLPETEALRTAIVSGLIGPSEPAWLPPPRPRRTTPFSSSRPPLIGRQDARTALDEELARAQRGQARVVLLSGELGIGKTRLWEDWSADLPDTYVVLESQGSEATQALPLVPVLRLLNLTQPPSARAADDRPPLWEAHTLALSGTGLADPGAEQRRVFETLSRLLAECASRALIAFVDDLHWADHATLDWLAYTVDRLAHEPFLLVGAYRPEDAPAQLARLIATWTRQDVVRRLVLPRLTADEAAALLAALGGDPACSIPISEQSAGNPYFVTELARAGTDGLPTTLVELIQTRLDRLPQATRPLVQAAAVLQLPSDFVTLQQMSGGDEASTLDALDRLLQADILTEQQGGYRFVHPLVGAVVTAGLSSARRTVLHQRAATVLERTAGERLGQLAGQLLVHYREAGNASKAAAYAELAGEHALRLAAWVEAVQFFRTALTLEPTLGRQLELGRALARAGELSEARSVFAAARIQADAQGDIASTTTAYIGEASALGALGKYDESAALAEDSLATVAHGSDPAMQVLAHLLLAADPLNRGRALAEAEAHFRTALQLVYAHQLNVLLPLIAIGLGNLLGQRGDLAGARQILQEGSTQAHAAKDDDTAAIMHNNLAYYALQAGDLEAAEWHVARGLELSETQRLRVPRQWLYSTRGEIALAEQAWEQAEGWFQRSLSEAQQLGNQVQIATEHANLGLAARGRGQLDSALGLLTQAGAEARASGAIYLVIQIDLWLAELHAQRAERKAAYDMLDQAEGQLAGSEFARLRAWATRIRAQITPSE
jgi:DNA-binding SARP family transcriptional activator